MENINKNRFKVLFKRGTLKPLAKVKQKVRNTIVSGISGFGTEFKIAVKIIKVKSNFAFIRNVTEVTLKDKG